MPMYGGYVGCETSFSVEHKSAMVWSSAYCTDVLACSTLHASALFGGCDCVQHSRRCCSSPELCLLCHLTAMLDCDRPLLCSASHTTERFNCKKGEDLTIHCIKI